jgi:two-component system phosphate regulon response regulator OmpR
MTKKLRVLIVDDDPRIRRTLDQALKSEGFETREARDGAEAMRQIERMPFDAVTLDLTLPDEDGLSVTRRVRQSSDVPIVMITAKADPVDRVVGLELGADDYVCKPFHVREVVARVRCVIRRREAAMREALAVTQQRRFSFEGWMLDVPARSLERADGSEVELTGMEFDLLALLVANGGEALSRDMIVERLKGQRWSPFDRGIDMLVRRLRQKIEADPAHPRLIKTVRGIGYVFAGHLESSEQAGRAMPRGGSGMAGAGAFA